MIIWEIVLAVLVGVAVCAAYLVGQHTHCLKREDLEEDATRYRVRRTSLLITYRNANDVTSSLRTIIIKVQHYADGRISLLGLCGHNKKMKEFRADRILAITSLEGSSLNVETLLTQRLRISPDKVAMALDRNQRWQKASAGSVATTIQ